MDLRCCWCRRITTCDVMSDMSAKRSRPHRTVTTFAFEFAHHYQSKCKSLVATVISAVENTDCRCLPVANWTTSCNQQLTTPVVWCHLITYLLVLHVVCLQQQSWSGLQRQIRAGGTSMDEYRQKVLTVNSILKTAMANEHDWEHRRLHNPNVLLHHVIGRNTLLCCSHFGWKFDDFVSGSIDPSNCALLHRHHKLVDSCDWHTVQFLSEIINVRDDVFSLDFSDGFTLSCQELNSIVLFLATDRQTWIIVLLHRMLVHAFL